MPKETSRRRIWCETVSLEELAAPRTLGLLARYRLHPIIAVRPDSNVRSIAALFRRLRDEGLSAALWPMLADADGRWASGENAGRFAQFTERLVGDLERENVPLAEVVVDLEPSIDRLRGALGEGVVKALLRSFERGPANDGATRLLGRLREGLGDRGVGVSAAVVPTVLLDTPRAPGWQALLGTPVDRVFWDRLSVMVYTSILEGWSERFLRREDALGVLALSAHIAQARFGDRAEISLGAVGTGALGDEPVYRSVSELEEDVAVALAHGAKDLALFDLGGVLRRPPAEAWLEAFVCTEASREKSRASARARLGVASAKLVGAAYHALFAAASAWR